MAYRQRIFNNLDTITGAKYADTDQSSGGTPWDSTKRIPSSVLPANHPGYVGLEATNPGYNKPFRGTVSKGQPTNSLRQRDPGNTQDATLIRVRRVWNHTGNISLPKNFGNWNASGPERPSMRMFAQNFRDMAGHSGQRLEGLHTNPGVPTRTLPGRPTMIPRSQNRLTVPRYRGQTYSNTTQILGT